MNPVKPEKRVFDGEDIGFMHFETLCAGPYRLSDIESPTEDTTSAFLWRDGVKVGVVADIPKGGEIFYFDNDWVDVVMVSVPERIRLHEWACKIMGSTSRLVDEVKPYVPGDWHFREWDPVGEFLSLLNCYHSVIRDAKESLAAGWQYLYHFPVCNRHGTCFSMPLPPEEREMRSPYLSDMRPIEPNDLDGW